MKIKSICLFSILLFSCSWCYGQSTLLWGKYLRGNSWFAPEGIATDRFNNTYVISKWMGLPNINNCNGGSTLYFGSNTIYFLGGPPQDFLVKYDKSGNELWATTSTQIPNYGPEGIYLSTDASGNVYEAGEFQNIMSIGAYTFNPGFDQNDIFLVKYSPNGNVLWALAPTIRNGNSGNGILDVRLSSLITDNAKNVILIGRSNDTLLIGSDTLTKNSNPQVIPEETFLVKFDSNGNLLWHTTVIDSTLSSVIYAATASTDKNNNILLTSEFQGIIKIGTTSLSSPTTGPNTWSIFLAKYSPAGNAIWATQTISNSIDNSTGIVVDNAGNSYITGVIESSSVQFGSHTLTSNSNGCLFVAKYDSNGNNLWAVQSSKTGFNNVNDYSGTSLSIDKCANLFVYGFLGQLDTIHVGSILLATNPIPSNIATYVIKFDSSGNSHSGFVLPQGGVLDDDGTTWPNNAITCDTLGNILLVALFQDTMVVNNDSLLSECFFNTATMKFTPDGYCCAGIFSSQIRGDTSICAGDSTTLVITNPGLNYKWSNGDTTSSITINPLSSTTYTLAINDSACILDLGTKVSVYPKPIPSLINNIGVCQGDSINLNASGGTTYRWSPDSGLNSTTLSSVTAKPLVNTTYTVIIANGGCSARDSINVFINSNPIVNTCCDSVIVSGQNVQLISSGGTSYSWSPPNGLSCYTCPNPVATPTQTTTYTLTVISDSGCIATQQVIIDVECGQVFVPDIFSPNQNVNNILYVRGPCIKDLLFDVFDRWGNKVFETQNKDAGWDGIYNGQPMNTGTYVYYAKATLYDGSVINKRGNVTLVR